MPGSNPWFHIAFSHRLFLVSSDLWQIQYLPLFFMILTILKSFHQVFCRMALNLGLPGIFLMIRLGCGFGGKYPGSEVPFSSHRIRDTWYQHDLSLVLLSFITWLRLCLSSFSNVNGLFSPFHALFVGSKSQSSSHFQREGELSYDLFIFEPISSLPVKSLHFGLYAPPWPDGPHLFWQSYSCFKHFPPSLVLWPAP